MKTTPHLVFRREYNPNFVGREAEMRWLDERLLSHSRRWSFRALRIAGPCGVGKTALIHHWLSSRRHTFEPVWVNLNSNSEITDSIRQVTTHLAEERHRQEVVVILDGADALSQQQYAGAAGSIFNYKVVSSLIFIARDPPDDERSDTLTLGPLRTAEASELLAKLSSGIDIESLSASALSSANGHPLAIHLIAAAMQSGNAKGLRQLLRNELYDFSKEIVVPSTEIAKVVVPEIITASSNLVQSLQNAPNDIRMLSPRQFEELLAELLSDQGWEVELTRQTRDGGKDILAYMTTSLGRILCLVEAKHYRPDRKVGVELVRTLYGTFCDAKANSAMLVTSSSFTPDAREFQRRYEYQLGLRDYADLVGWIEKYGNKGKNV